MTTTSYTYNGHEINIDSYSPTNHTIRLFGVEYATVRTIGAAKRKAHQIIDRHEADEAERAENTAKYEAMSDEELRAILANLRF